MSDAALQRKNMVESQVRPSDVTDRRILRAMSDLAREDFVPASSSTLAYADSEIVVAQARTGSPARAMLPGRLLAKLLQLAALDAGDRVLVVGANSGYSAALVARLAKSVVALECDAALAQAARTALSRQNAGNVAVVESALASGHAEGGPYDAIVLEGAIVGEPPQALLNQLGENGRLVAVRMSGRSGTAVLWQKSRAALGETVAFDATARVLPGFEPAPAFVF